MRDLTPEIIKMWSDELKEDAWWIVEGYNYIGPFKKWCDAKIFKGESMKPFDITKHEVYDHISVFDANNIVVEDAKWVINKDRAIAIAKSLGVTGEDLK